jgi:hypothetical protein
MPRTSSGRAPPPARGPLVGLSGVKPGSRRALRRAVFVIVAGLRPYATPTEAVETVTAGMGYPWGSPLVPARRDTELIVLLR